ncbi:MAG: trimethylamine methyltransferase family protein, partial [Desulfobacteraceae bacterium]|nr:trimethylamine methyltransferase family protein [Desulfobacteraceae bacterium]
ANTPDSKLPDAQMGLEAMQHIQMLALGGCNLIHVSIGNLEMMKLASFEACLIANDIFGAVYRILQGVDCSNEAIGVDVFKEVRHDSRYLETMHAAKYCRANERWSPKLIDRNSWDAWWQQTGGKDMAQRANEMARKILKEHHPEYVTAKERKEINKICKEAENWLTNKRKNSD